MTVNELSDIAKRAGVAQEEFDNYLELTKKSPDDKLSYDEEDLLFRVAKALGKQIAKERYRKRPRRQRREDHQEIWQIAGGYTAFIAASMLAVLSSGRDSAFVSWAFSLWAISLPFLCGFMVLDRIIRVQQKRLNSTVRGLLMGVGFSVSHLGTAAMVSFFSWLGAVAYLLSPFLVAFFVHETAALGGRENFEDL